MGNRIKKSRKRNNQKTAIEEATQIVGGAGKIDGQIELVQMLLPLGLAAVKDILDQEVEQLVGARYNREGRALKRWGYNAGSVYLGEEKVKVQVPRVRDLRKKKELALQSYQGFQQSQRVNQQILARVIHGIGTRQYEKTAVQLPTVFGIKKSSVSRRFIRATSARLEEFFSRDLSDKDIVAIFMDGKHLAETDMVLALGITMKGEKIVLGFVETGTENQQVIREFLEGLISRGLSRTEEILFVVDGAKGLIGGIRQVFGRHAFIQRCQWHKRENILSYLSKSQAQRLLPRLQGAYAQPTYQRARKALHQVGRELELMNQSARISLEEGLEETLTLHQLGVIDWLGCSFKTTNCLESFNSQIERYTRRITYWRNSSQRQRWLATVILEVEQGLRKVKGYLHLPKLREAMHREFLKQSAKSEAA